MLAGMVLALQCVPRSTRVHLFGYNWTQKGQFHMHRMAIEARYAALMAAAGRLTIHPSPCQQLRQCDPPDPPPQVGAGHAGRHCLDKYEPFCSHHSP